MLKCSLVNSKLTKVFAKAAFESFSIRVAQSQWKCGAENQWRSHGELGGRVPTPAYKSRFLKWPKSGEKFFKEWAYLTPLPYANEDQVQSVQLQWQNLIWIKSSIYSSAKHARRNTQNDCHQWLSDSSGVHQIRFRPDPAGGAYDSLISWEGETPPPPRSILG